MAEEKKVLRKTRYEMEDGSVKVYVVYNDFSSEEIIEKAPTKVK